MSEDSARLIVEVTAGVILGSPDPAVTRRWVLTSSEWESTQRLDVAIREQKKGNGAQDSGEPPSVAALRLETFASEADAYAEGLRDPARFNFVRTDWIWL